MLPANFEAVPVIADTIAVIRSSSSQSGAGIKALRLRSNEFPTQLERDLTGIAMVPEARRYMDAMLDGAWSRPLSIPDLSGSEVVVGAGFHAAVYCAARVLSGFPKPYVLERESRPGGVLATSKNGSFYLNSTNRPGLIGSPGEMAALNYLPGALIQPASLSLNEYHSNADMAFVIRLMLAQFANVIVGADVESVSVAPGGGIIATLRSLLTGRRTLTCARLIDARGLGDEVPAGRADDRVLTFLQFVARLDEPFPMQDWDRVAVIGGGDSGKCAVEALLGIGPSQHMSVPALDFVNSVDWYAPNLPQSCPAWRGSQRGRYMRIASYLGDGVASRRSRLMILVERGKITPSFDSVLVNGRVYDHVIFAGGFSQTSLWPEYGTTPVGSNPQLAGKIPSRSAYVVGPMADIGFSNTERSDGLSSIAANRVAMWRLAPRTAALAVELPAA